MEERIAPVEQPRFVVCLRNDGYELDLALNERYEVLPDALAERSGWIRVVDDTGEDYLYPAGYFGAMGMPDARRRETGARPTTPG